jgi:outer membrane lipoprotein carrier protein
MLRYARSLFAVSALAVLVPALASEAHAQATKAPAPAKKGAAQAAAKAPAKKTPAAPAKVEAAREPNADAKVEPKAEPKSETKGKLGEAEVAAEVARVQANYEKVRSFRARFKQDYWVKAYDQRKKSTGTVVFARPGKMSWSYEEPKGNRVVSDGKLLRVYEEGAKQLFEQPVDKSQYPQALGFLTGESKLAETFTFEGNEGASMSFPGGIVLVATPRQPLATVQKVLLYVDAATHYVRRVLLLDAQGNRNRFDFEDVKLDDATDAREFSFTPPAGTAVIHP